MLVAGIVKDPEPVADPSAAGAMAATLPVQVVSGHVAAASASRWRGIALMAAGGLLFSLMGAMAKAASDTLPTFELVLFRSVVTWIVIELVRRQARVPLEFHGVPILLSRSIAGFIGVASYFYALRYIPLGDAVLLNNASPVLTTLGAVLLLGERMTVTKGVALAASMAGVWLLVGVHSTGMAAQGAWVGAASAVASAWALVSLKLATRRNRSLIVVWCLAAMCTLGSLPFYDSTWILPDTAREWALVTGTGATAAGAQLLMTMGYRLLDASEASIYSYLNPVFAGLMGVLWFGDVPALATWLGGALIVVAGGAVAWSERNRTATIAA